MAIRHLLLFCALGLAAQPMEDIGRWKALRAKLLADESALEEIRGSTLPLSGGYVVAMDPPVRPHTLMIGIETPLVAELKLRISRDGVAARMASTPPRKSRIQFKTATVESFTKRPFLITAVTDELGLDYEEAPAERP